MSTAAQISANRANAQHSTGPRTREGKSTVSQNGVTLGLFAREYARPEERAEYEKLHADLNRELAPVGVLETTLVDEIRRATWRLLRCSEIEATLGNYLNEKISPDLDPIESSAPNVERAMRSVDRARAQAHRILHKCTAELRRLQTDRELSTDNSEPTPLADRRALAHLRAKQTQINLQLHRFNNLQPSSAATKPAVFPERTGRSVAVVRDQEMAA